LYELNQDGNSTNGQVDSLIPNSAADATEETDDGFATVGEQFDVVFTDSATNDIYGGTYTYVGHLTDYPAVVGQNDNGDYFLFSNDGSIPIGSNLTGFVAEDLAICFLTGTMIACPGGESAVESLKIGDLVLTADGRAVPVKWLGRQTISTFFGMPEPRRPIRICAGALGEGLPVRDLRVTADHALLIDGVLVHAAALVNGTTIRSIPSEELGQRFIVYHVETEDHEVILAEGTPAETFVDNVARSRFDNYAEFVALYGEAPEPIAQLTQPRAMSRRQLPAAIKARIAAAAAQLAGSESMAG
jgi:hypothetical protein